MWGRAAVIASVVSVILKGLSCEKTMLCVLWERGDGRAHGPSLSASVTAKL